MTSKLSAESVDDFGKVFSATGEKEDILFNIRILQLALKFVELSRTDPDFDKIVNSLENTSNGKGMLKKLLELEEDAKLEISSGWEQIRSVAIYSLGSFIERLGSLVVLKTEKELDEIIKENEIGEINLDKLNIILDKDDENDCKIEYFDPAWNDIPILKKKIICLGIITKAISNTMTEEDMSGTLSDENEFQEETKISNYSGLFTIMQCIMKEISYTEADNESEKLYTFDEGDHFLSYVMRSVMCTLGTAMLMVGENLTECSVLQAIENEDSFSPSDFPEMVISLLEKEFTSRHYNINTLDQQEMNYSRTEEWEKILSPTGDICTDDKVGFLIKEVEISENCEIDYQDYISKLTLENEIRGQNAKQETIC